jgi:hypothetical protein
MDLAIVFDGSDSVKADNFKKLKARVQKKKKQKMNSPDYGCSKFKIKSDPFWRILDNFWTKFLPKNIKLFSFWCFLTQILIKRDLTPAGKNYNLLVI